MRRQGRQYQRDFGSGRSARARAVAKRYPAVTFDRVMHTMSRDATAITAAHETTCARMALDRGMTGRLVHHRGAETIVMACAFHFRRVQCHLKKEAAIAATTTVRAISTTIGAIKDRKTYNNEHRVKATVVTSAKPHSISRLRGESTSLDAA